MTSEPVPDAIVADAPDAAEPEAPVVRRAASDVHPTPRLTAGSLAFLALFIATYVVFVLTPAGQQLENLGLEGSALRGTSSQTDSLLGLGSISVVTFGITIAIFAAIALLRGRPALAIAVVAAMGGSALMAEAFKDVLPRPEHIDGPAWLLRNSFPSGHATVAAAMGAGLIVVAPARLRWLALPVAAIGTAVIGQATQIAGWHRASDAIGAVFLALAVTTGTLAVLAWRGMVVPEERGRVHRRVHRGLLVLGLLIVALAALLLLLPLLFPLLRAPNGAEGVFVHLGTGLAGTGITLFAMDAFGRLLEPLSLGTREGRPPAAADRLEAGAG
jgi:membrane-associated phospholipid phosphatase